MQRFVATPAEYLAQVPAEQRPAVDLLRKLIRESIPKTEESIKMGFLCYSDAAGDCCCLGAQKNYIALYVPTEAVAMMSAELADIDHGKCCLRFKKLEKIPSPTIKKLLKLAVSQRKETAALPAAEKRSPPRKKKAAKRKSSK